MIVRVWGIVNETSVTFTPIKDRPDYWEGYAPRVKGLQDIEIWAENDQGARGHLKCSVVIQWHTHTQVRLVLSPYIVTVIDPYQVSLMPFSQ